MPNTVSGCKPPRSGHVPLCSLGLWNPLTSPWRRNVDTPGPFQIERLSDFNNHTQFSCRKSRLILNFHHSYWPKLPAPLPRGMELCWWITCLVSCLLSPSFSLPAALGLCSAGPLGEGERGRVAVLIPASCRPRIGQASHMLVLCEPLIPVFSCVTHELLGFSPPESRRPLCTEDSWLHLISVVSLPQHAALWGKILLIGSGNFCFSR